MFLHPKVWFYYGVFFAVLFCGLAIAFVVTKEWAGLAAVAFFSLAENAALLADYRQKRTN